MTPPPHGSTNEQHDEVERQILATYRAQNASMIAADTSRLDELLEHGYVAIHISGYQQPKDEWLEQMRNGRMAYHSITEQSAVVTTHEDEATLNATALVEATIYGGYATWRIRSVTRYQRSGGRWKATSSTSTNL